MNVLLINPCYDETKYRYKVNKLTPPLGMAYIASVLRQNQHSVEILDMEAINMTYDKLESHLHNSLPNIVGIHGTTPIAKYIYRCANIVKRTLPDASVVLGGAHATLLPEEVFANSSDVDYILRGECEFTMTTLANVLSLPSINGELKSIPGICFRENGKTKIAKIINRIDQLNTLPLPAYDLLPLEFYFDGNNTAESDLGERIFPMLTSRGCPYSCIFCCDPVLQGHKYRARSAKSVVDEMELLNYRYKISHIVIYDSSFLSDIKRVENICNEILKRKLEITWRVRVRANKLTKQLVKLMKKAGCITFGIGVESGSQRLLDRINKKTTLDEIRRGFEIAKEEGMWTVGYFMIGLPSETIMETDQTIQFAIELDPDWALFSHTTPLPGTKLFEISACDLRTDDWSEFKISANSPVLSYDGLNHEDSQNVLKYAYSSFYLRKEWLMNRLKKVHSVEAQSRIYDSLFYHINKVLPDYCKHLPTTKV